MVSHSKFQDLYCPRILFRLSYSLSEQNAFGTKHSIQFHQFCFLFFIHSFFQKKKFSYPNLDPRQMHFAYCIQSSQLWIIQFFVLFSFICLGFRFSGPNSCVLFFLISCVCYTSVVTFFLEMANISTRPIAYFSKWVYLIFRVWPIFH